MFKSLQEKLEGAFKKIRGRGVLTPNDIEATMRDVRMALLDADVNFKVAKEFCARIGEKAKGEEVLKSLTPDQQIVKLVHEELVETMGRAATPLNLKAAPPVIIMLVGLQGSGKTTTAAKLARLIKSEHKRNPLLVPADIYRPAAIDQLKTLGQQIGIEVFPSDPTHKPLEIAKQAVELSNRRGFDTLIIDTAGRLQIDATLMHELKELNSTLNPQEILLVVDAMTGQEAVNVATGFDQALSLTGLVLTKLDGDARGGAALSMRAVTGKPIKFIGVGEKPDGFETFHPERMASRILGMGDVLSLIEKATKEINVEESLALQKKLRKNEFSLEDFLSQLNTVRKMGSITSIAGMIPGMSKMVEKVNPEEAEKEMKRIEAIILSMTPSERRNPAIINGSRRRRIATGSGTTVQAVNQLLKQFLEMKKVMQKFTKLGAGGLMKMLGGGGLGGLMRGMR